MPNTDLENEKLSRAVTLKDFWQPRDIRIKDEREFLLSKQPKVVRKGFMSVVMNEAKVLYDTSVSLLSGSDPKFRLPLHNQNEAEKAKMNGAERFLTGVFREVNRLQTARGRERWLKEISWYIVGGWYAVFPLIEADSDNNPIFRWEIYDPITIYPRWDNRKLIELARVFWMDSESAVNMAEQNGWIIPERTKREFNRTGNNAEIINYWYTEFDGKKDVVRNAVYIDSQISKRFAEEPGSDIGIIVSPVGGTPVRAVRQSDKDWVIRMGESVIATNRGMYEQQNRWVSLMMQVVQDTAFPPIIDTTKTGQPKVRPEDMGSGKIHHRQIGETLDTFRHASTPIEVNTLLSMLNQSVQRGGLPFAIHGNIPFELSGFALSQLMTGARHKLVAYILALTDVISECAIRTMKLYKEGDFNSIELMVNDKKGETFIEEFDPQKDIPNVRFVEVDVPLATPVDKNQLIVAASQAVTNKLLSRETIWDTFSELGVEDKDIEYQRLIDDEMAFSPVMILIHAIERLEEIAQKHEEKNPSLADRLRQYQALLIQQLASQGVTGGETPQPEMAGGAVPPERLGEPRAAQSAAEGKVPPQTLASAANVEREGLGA